MNIRALYAWCLLLVVVFWSVSGWADGILPGHACPAAGRIMQTGGSETGGVGSMMVCESGVWKDFMSFNGSGHITRIGHQTCSNGQVLSFDGTKWACGAKGTLDCTTQKIGCPAGYTMTGNTPDLILGIGSLNVCCRVQ